MSARRSTLNAHRATRQFSLGNTLGERWTVPLLVGLVAFGAVVLVMWGRPQGRPSLDARVKAIATQLRCPVCQGESVYDAPAQMAADMRGIIRRQLEAGETPDQIKSYFVARYGQWILLAPTAAGIGYLVWTLPLLFGLGGLLLVGVLGARWRRQRVQSSKFKVQSESVSGGAGALGDALDYAPSRATQGPGVETSSILAERETILLALEQVDDDVSDGTLSPAEADAERTALRARLAAVEGVGAEGPASTPAVGQRHVRTGLALLGGAAVVAGSLAFALQPRGANAITGSSPSSARPTAPTNQRIPADVQRAVRDVNAHPRSIRAWVVLGSVLTVHRDYGDARSAYENGLRVQPRATGAELGLAFVEVLTGQDRQALVVLRRVERQAPGSSRAWLLEGLARSRLKGERRAALAAWQHFLTMDPHNPLAPQVRRWMEALRL